MSWQAAVLLVSISITILVLLALTFVLQGIAIVLGRCPRCLRPVDHDGWSCPGEFGR